MIDDIVPQGATDVSLEIWVLDNSGALVTGLAAADVSAWYKRPLSTKTSISLSDLTSETDVHSDGGWIETDVTGKYRIDPPDAAFARGENWTRIIVQGTTTGAGEVQVRLDPYPSVIQGAVSDASATSTGFDTDLAGNYSDDVFIDSFLFWVESTVNHPAIEKITDYADTGGTITTNAFPSAPADGDQFLIINR